MRIEHNFSLRPFNTFGMDVKAATFMEYTQEEELVACLPVEEACLHIGRGSNLLFTRDYTGTILHSAILGKEIVEEDAESVLVRVGSGEVWDDFVAWAVSEGLSGVENLSLIPGETGAAAVQNIGAYGAEVAEAIERIETIRLCNGEQQLFTRPDCRYAYRQSIFKNELKGQYAITRVLLRLSKVFVPRLSYGGLASAVGPHPTLAGVRQAVIDIRSSKLPDPSVAGNAGSFFMNPVIGREAFERLRAAYPQVPHYEQADGVKVPAGWLIEQCGWKGKALGQAAVHDKQALVLVNLGRATGEEIVRLAEAVAADVQAKFGIAIHPEVNIY